MSLQATRSRIEKTEQEYLVRVSGFLREFKKWCEENNEQSDDFDKMAQWFADTKCEGYTFSTWRKYKASFAFFLRNIDREDLALKVEAMPKDGVIKKSTRTTATKRKFLTEEEETCISDYLDEIIEQDDNPVYQAVRAFFHTILATGVRPIELPSLTLYQTDSDDAPGNTIYNGEFPMLRVKNAKNTNNRTFGEYRYIDISSFDAVQIKTLEVSIMCAVHRLGRDSSPVTTWHSYYEVIRKQYERFVNRALPKGRNEVISLYSNRHQFIANLKSQDYSLTHIAAIVGHGNDVTAKVHYGRKQKGRKGGNLPKANEQDVLKVKQLATFREPQLKSEKQKVQ